MLKNNFNKQWDFRFLDLAKLVSDWSKDRTKVGAVLVRPNKSIASVGFNGLPNTILAGKEPQILANRKDKILSILHAEENCLLFAKGSLKDCSVYTYPLLTCSKCCSLLLQAGINRFVTIKLPQTDERFLRWKDSFKLTRKLIKLSDVELIEYDDYEV